MIISWTIVSLCSSLKIHTNILERKDIFNNTIDKFPLPTGFLKSGWQHWWQKSWILHTKQLQICQIYPWYQEMSKEQRCSVQKQCKIRGEKNQSRCSLLCRSQWLLFLDMYVLSVVSQQSQASKDCNIMDFTRDCETEAL